MKLLLCISFLVASTYASTDKWTGMRVTYGPLKLLANNSYLWDVPLTLTEALSGIWENITLSNDLNAQFVGVSQNDYGFTPLYDANGYLGGAQICQPADTLLANLPSTNDPTALGSSEYQTINNTRYLCSTFLVVDPITLRAGGRTAPTKIGDGVWFKNATDTDTGYVQVPDDIDVLLNTTVYTWQNCFYAMGKHYMYNYTEEFDCNRLYNWFLTSLDNDVTGVGWQVIGQKTVVDYNWFDSVNRWNIDTITPVVNQCLPDWVESYGAAQIHVFFVDSWDIFCTASESVDPCAATGIPLVSCRRNTTTST